MDDQLKRRAIALYDRYTHQRLDRRAFLAELSALAGGTVAANALLGAIAADPAAAAIVAADDSRLRAKTVTATLPTGRVMSGYAVEPLAAKQAPPTVIVVHENRGLNEHIRDVTRRVALAGFVGFAPDFLVGSGGTPTDEDKARELIGALDLQAAVDDCVAIVDALSHYERGRAKGRRKVGITGFCWGGAMASRVAVAAGARLSAAAPFYGPAPPPSEAGKVKAPMLLHFAAEDPRVNVTAQPWIDALKAAKVPVDAYFYEGTEHAFHNDTSAARYDAIAAELAWGRTIAFFRKHLA